MRKLVSWGDILITHRHTQRSDRVHNHLLLYDWQLIHTEWYHAGALIFDSISWLIPCTAQPASHHAYQLSPPTAKLWYQDVPLEVKPQAPSCTAIESASRRAPFPSTCSSCSAGGRRWAAGFAALKRRGLSRRLRCRP